MRVIIVGCGRVGSTLARMLADANHEVVIVDQTSDSFRRLGPKYRGTRQVGSGTDIDALKRAGIEKADVFVSVTDGDNRNIMAAQIARSVFDVPTVLTRIYDPSRAAAYRELGIQTICTTTIAANLMFDLAEGEPVTEFVQELQNVRSSGGSAAAGNSGPRTSGANAGGAAA
ncbi:MAG TPA: TrkA family potassium uptake protein [Armatimonadaceae bacterium]|nr:TrkA family potassium uptake protein [Armatimonadaceae bacterium]